MANQTRIAYGSSQPLINVFPDPIRAKRAPTVNDKLAIGQWWIDELHNQVYTLTSITDNQAHWSTLTVMGVGVFNAVEATTGDIVSDLGNITATVGNISAGGTITSGAALTVATGDLGVLTGDINVVLGNVLITNGNLRVTTGDIDTVAGAINSASTITAGTTITAAGNITSSAGNLVASAGNIVATLGTVSAVGITSSNGLTVSSGDVHVNDNLVVDTGNLEVTTGELNVLTGNINASNKVIVTGDIESTAGNISADTGDIFGGNINVIDTSSFTGQFIIQGAPFLHAVNSVLNYNTAVGYLASALGTLATWNTIVGALAMNSMTDTDGGNVAIGYNCMNAAAGNCVFNTACGTGALELLTQGIRNCCFGRLALAGITTGSYNIAIGNLAGSDYASVESSNICIGHVGIPLENNVIRIGTDGIGVGHQNKCYIAGDVETVRSITAQTGNITCSAGNFVASTAGQGVTLGGGASVVCGAGDPNGVVTAAKGSLYLNTTGSAVNDRAWINTDGGTTWTNLTTAA